MRRVYMDGIILSLLAFLVGGCGSGNKEGSARPVGTACFQCHGNAATAPQMKVYYQDSTTFANFSTTVNLFVDPVQYAASTHGGVECIKCHTEMNPVPPHNAPRAYGGWGAIWPLNDRTTNTNLSTAPGTTDADVNHTLNYNVVPAAACLSCHGDQTLMAYFNSKHANDNDRAFLPSASGPWSGGPRVATFPFGPNGPQVNETYNAVDCQLCHIGSNCGTCHFKSPIGQQIAGDAWKSWNTYTDNTVPPGSSIGNYDTKLGQINRWIDWTQNIASHNFNRAADLKSSNDVCSACHSGFSDGPHSGDNSYTTVFSVTGTAYDGHSENDEVALTVARGIHTTKSHCADCHLDTHTTNIPQTLSMGWDTTKSQTKCINCHADKAFATGSLHADVDCSACHDGNSFSAPVGTPEVPENLVERDLTSLMIVPYHVDVNIQKAFTSHNLVHGSDIDCAVKCHFLNNGLALPGGLPVLVGPARGDGFKVHQ